MESSKIEAFGKIKLIGIGGGGKNSLNRLIKLEKDLPEAIYINTSASSLNEAINGTKLLIGHNCPKLNGFGSNGKVGLVRKAGKDHEFEIEAALEESDIVCITSTLGGGTGSALAPLVAKIARRQGAKVVAFVTRPFKFEGRKRTRKAREAVRLLKKYVDVLFEFNNEDLLLFSSNMPLQEAFSTIDQQIAVAISAFVNQFNNNLIHFDPSDFDRIIDGFFYGKVISATCGSFEEFPEMVDRMESQLKKLKALDKFRKGLINISSSPELSSNQLFFLIESITSFLPTQLDFEYSHNVSQEGSQKTQVNLVLLKASGR